MKRFLSLVISAVMMISVCTSAAVCAFAEDPDDTIVTLADEGSCGDNTYYEYLSDRQMLIINGYGTIAENAFAGIEGIKDVVLNEGIIGIGAGAFTDCTDLQSIAIVNPECAIDDTAFNTASLMIFGYEYIQGTIPSTANQFAQEKSYTFAEFCGEKDHNYELVNFMGATCEEGGFYEYICTDCLFPYYRAVEPQGHDYVNGVCVLCGMTDYKFTSGANSAYTKGTKDGLTFTVNGSPDDFSGVIIDGARLSDDYYTISGSDSTVITLSSKYLDKLESKTHTITAEYLNGSAETDFTVNDAVKTTKNTNVNKSKKSPKTGAAAFGFSMALLGGGVLAIAADKKRKTK